MATRRNALACDRSEEVAAGRIWILGSAWLASAPRVRRNVQFDLHGSRIVGTVAVP